MTRIITKFAGLDAVTLDRTGNSCSAFIEAEAFARFGSRSCRVTTRTRVVAETPEGAIALALARAREDAHAAALAFAKSVLVGEVRVEERAHDVELDGLVESELIGDLVSDEAA